MKKFLFQLIAASIVFVQLSEGAALADLTPTHSPVITPEAQLLAQIYITQGKDVQSLYSAYDQTAPQDHREERMAQAAVDLNIMTQARAEQIMAQVHEEGAKLIAQNSFTPDAISTLSQTTLQKFVAHGSSGAAFSCGDRALTGVFLIVGSGGLIAIATKEHSSALNSLSIVTLLAGLVFIVTAPGSC